MDSEAGCLAGDEEGFGTNGGAVALSDPRQDFSSFVGV